MKTAEKKRNKAVILHLPGVDQTLGGSRRSEKSPYFALNNLS